MGSEDIAGYGVVYDDMLSDTNAQLIREGVTQCFDLLTFTKAGGGGRTGKDIRNAVGIDKAPQSTALNTYYNVMIHPGCVN